MDLQTERLRLLSGKGVKIPDPRQTYVDEDVELERIGQGVTLYPGTRISGLRTLIGAGAVIGREGPVTLINAALGDGVAIASGFVEDSVILHNAAIGANCHLRAGCLLEEQVKTAHCVGLKQTILMSYVTLGSLINFCDVLMSGGTSRKDHSEVGSGYIHFNFTPWGKHGGKATPSLCGDVEAGALLRSQRIFLGGSGGLVGPRSVGYGSVVAAGQVVREDVAEGRLVSQAPIAMDRPVTRLSNRKIEELRKRNIEYLAQIMTLRLWYESVRLPRAGAVETPLVEAAIRNLSFCIEERIQLANALFVEYGHPPLAIAVAAPAAHSLPLDRGLPHIQWVQSLPDAAVQEAADWLRNAAQQYRSSMQ